MASRVRTPYHLGPQSATALLNPIEAALADLEVRLAHYVERIAMPDDDRELIAKARDVIAQSRSQISELIPH